MQTILGASKTTKTNKNCPSAQQLLDFFNAKIAAVRHSTGDLPVLSSLPPAAVSFTEFETCTVDDVRSVIMCAPSKSCSLDPLPTNILKEYLPELLPFLTNLCNVRKGSS